MSKKALLDKIINDAADAKQTPVVQILLSGQLIQGALSINEEFAELYIVQGPQEMQGQTVLAIWTFGAEDVSGIAAFQPMDGSSIVTPKGHTAPGGLAI